MAEIAKIEKLNGANYQSWKYNAKLVLMERGLWGFTQEGQEIPPEETATATVRNAFRLRKDKAYSLIALNVEKDLQVHISSVTDPLVAWQTLQKQFEFISVTQIVRLTRKFYAASMEEGGDLMQHLTAMTSLAEQLRELKEEISSKKFATVVLGSLPASYDNFLTSLNARNADDLDWENVKGLLIEEFMKRKDKSEREANENALFAKRDQQHVRQQNQNGAQRGRRNFRGRGARGGQHNSSDRSDHQERMKHVQCYNCQQFGHYSRDCGAKKHSRRNEGSNLAMEEKDMEEEREGVALICSGDTSTEKWFIDSAATKHMTNDKTILKNFIQYRKPTKIYLGDDTVVLALGEGEVDLPTPDVVLNLHKVLFVPDMTKNLLSVPAMALMKAQVCFDEEHCVIEKNGREYVIGSLHDKLYMVNTVEYAHVSTAQTSDASIEVWHCRFGHLNYDYVNKLTKEEMVQGMKIHGSTQPNKQCEACIMGKMQRKSPPKQSTQRATRPFEVLHSDICGPMQVPSKGGSRYMLTFTDDYSRFVTTYFIKNRSEMLTKFKECVNYIERQFGYHVETLVLPDEEEDSPKVKTLRSDNGGEYVSKEATKFCKEKGISQEYTNPYCPEQNGVAERLNRTIMESARSMLQQANLPQEFWAEACNTAVYNHNRSPTAALQNKTPFECVFRRKPNVSHLRVFGCVSYVHVPDNRRKKLDAKARKAIFVGYPSGVKGYKLYDIEKKMFIISRNVIFWENRFDHTCETKNKELSSFYPKGEDDEELSVPEIPIERNEVHEEPTAAPGEPAAVEGTQRKQTYEDAFMKEVEKLPNVRQRKPPPRFRDEECFVARSLTTDVDEPDTVEAALCGEKSQQWKEAMDAEYSSLMENETWDLVPPPEGVNVVGSRWVFKIKRDEEGEIDRHKARLVAQGYSQTQGVDYQEVFSPVARQASLRSLLALANAHNLEVHQMDVKTAFLNGEIDCDIYMKQPEGFVDPNKPDYVCKLNKSIYGLKQSARCWNTTLEEYLKSADYHKSGADGCMYVKTVKEPDNHINFVILGVYVDDIVVVSNNPSMLNAEKSALCRRFKMSDQGEVHYLLGMLVQRDRESRTLTISQPGYLKKVLERFGMQNCKPVTTPMETGRKFEQITEDEEPFDVQTYQQAIGCLTYASTTTRPDISAAVGVLSQYSPKPSESHWTGVKRVLRYIKGTLSYGLKFTAAEGSSELVGYSDADWAGDPDTRRSTSGYVFRIGDGTVSWCSKKQATVAKSSTEAEYVALSMATQEAIWLRRLMSDLGKMIDSPTKIYEDNQGAIELAKNAKYHNRTKHIDICHHFVRERVSMNEITIDYCPSEEMVADVMTKGLPTAKFTRLREMLGVHSIV